LKKGAREETTECGSQSRKVGSREGGLSSVTQRNLAGGRRNGFLRRTTKQRAQHWNFKNTDTGNLDHVILGIF